MSRPDAAPLPPGLDLAVFRQMADLSNEGFYLLDRRGRFLYVNAQAHAQMGGYTVEELLGLTVSDICPDVPAERFAEYVAALAHGPMPLVESWTRRKDGTMFPAEVSMARLEFDGDVYLFGVARDLTERKATEAMRTSLAARLLETIERERQRVARELHDDVGQALATIGVLLTTLELDAASLPAVLQPALVATRATVGQIGTSLARIVREYHPVELLGLGLEDTLRTHARQLAERHGHALELHAAPGDWVLAPEQELHVYRIVQEALLNSGRHAGARTVRITLQRESTQLIVGVHDDGRGFDLAHPPARGIGLDTMRERAMLLHGTLAIESAPGRGTIVTLALPLAPPADGPASRAPLTPASSPAGPHAAPSRAVSAAGPAGGFRIVRTLRGRERAAARAEPPPLPAALDLEVFRRMADMASEAFLLADRDGRFLWVNDRACTLSEFARAELLAMSVSDINPEFPPDAWRAWVATAEGPLSPFETWNWRKDGTLFPVEVSAARIGTPDEPYFFGVVRDISERKEAEAIQDGFTRRLLHTLEAERQRVARDLHDEVGQAIATVGVLLHTLENTPGSIPDAVRPSLATTHATIRQITEAVARIVRDYHPADLLGLGLEESLRIHARRFAQDHGLVLRLATTSLDGLLSDEHALHVFRIVQEALANVARHARARKVSMRLTRRRGRLVATIRDDGRGFDPAHARTGGFGLVTMRERAALMGATLELRSRPGHGTEVQLVVDGRGHAAPAPGQRLAAGR